MRLARLDKVVILMRVRIKHEWGDLDSHSILHKLIDVVDHIQTVVFVAKCD